ncbi:MAG: MFS transporter [Christensenellales bacterium]|jgi:OPA family glycerol-3-phosphate transporter-like MFS transporter
MRVGSAQGRRAALFTAVCFAAYFSAYLGRQNFAACIPSLTGSGLVGRAEAGAVATAFSVCYGAGQLLAGFGGDRLPPKYLIAAGLAGSGLCNLAMAGAGGFGALLGVWMVNGLCQSLLWTPLLRLAGLMLPFAACTRACTALSLAVGVGPMGALLLSGGLLAAGPWQGVFWVPGAWLLAMAALFYAAVTRLERRPVPPDDAPPPGDLPRTPNRPAPGLWRAAWGAGLPLLCAMGLCTGVLKDGVPTWIPTLIDESFRLGSVLSVMTATALPLVSLAGIWAARRIERRLDQAGASALFFLGGALAMAALTAAGSRSLPLALTCLGALSCAAMGLNTLVMTLMPLRFAPLGGVSSVCGIVNACCHAGAALAGYGIGRLSEAAGWPALLAVLAGVGLAGAGAALALIRPWAKFCKGR